MLLVKDAAPPRFSGMGGEGGLDIQFFQERQHLPVGKAILLQAVDGFGDRLRAGMGAVAVPFPLPVDTNDLTLLSVVHQMKKGRISTQ